MIHKTLELLSWNHREGWLKHALLMLPLPHARNILRTTLETFHTTTYVAFYYYIAHNSFFLCIRAHLRFAYTLTHSLVSSMHEMIATATCSLICGI